MADISSSPKAPSFDTVTGAAQALSEALAKRDEANQLIEEAKLDLVEADRTIAKASAKLKELAPELFGQTEPRKSAPQSSATVARAVPIRPSVSPDDLSRAPQPDPARVPQPAMLWPAERDEIDKNRDRQPPPMEGETPARVTLQTYARMRGVTAGAIWAAIRAGRLKPPAWNEEVGSIDVAEADRQLESAGDRVSKLRTAATQARRSTTSRLAAAR